MTTYAIGDIQGCYEELISLIEAISFNPREDHLIIVGDLVNRGPKSLEVLRYIRSLESSATILLGNHDLHLLARAQGSKAGRRDTLEEVLSAPDREELLDWLSRQKLAFRHAPTDTLLVHAGVAPQWSVSDTLALANEAEEWISGPKRANFLSQMYGDQPDQWDPELRDVPRIRFIINVLTRWRYCTPEGQSLLDYKGPVASAPANVMPWFQVPGRKSLESSIAFGHWSALGQIHWPQDKVSCLDTGCIWGGSLTAMDLETRQITQVASAVPRTPDI